MLRRPGPLLVPLLAVLLAACGGDADESAATLRVEAIGAPGDPQGAPQRLLAGATQTGLVSFNGAGEVVPGLASSWRVTADGRSIIFRLRAAKWSDGRPLRAADVVDSFRRLATGKGPPTRQLLAPIAGAPAVLAGRAPAAKLGISAPLDTVVEVRLTAPAPALLGVLALPEMAVTRPGKAAPTIGPFRIAERSGALARLKPDRDWFGHAEVRLGEIVLRTESEPVAAMARLTRDAADIVTGGGVAGLGDARTLPAPRMLRIEPVWGVYGYAVGVRSGPLADVRVRRALAMAIDRTALLAQPFAVPAMAPMLGVLPPTLPGAASILPDWAALDLPARRAEAARLLAEAGYGPEAPLALTVSLPPGREHGAILAAVAADWAPLGVTVTANVRSMAGHASQLGGRFELALVERRVPVASPAAMLLPLRCGFAAGGYCSPEADAAIRAAQLGPDAAARSAGLAQAQALLVADMPLIPLFTPVRWSLVNPRVVGWTDNPAGQHPLAALAMPPPRKILR